jgi:hypothetical protein
MKSLLTVAVFLLALAGCGSSEFDAGTAQEVLQAAPVGLQGEQILLTGEQVVCGDKEGLWHLTSLGAGRAIGRLTEKGRALQLSDDVRVGDAGAPGPVVQVTGRLPVRVQRIAVMKNENQRNKIIEARTTVVLEHPCFREPPVLLGVSNGQFSSSANPRFRLRRHDDQWTFDALLH